LLGALFPLIVANAQWIWQNTLPQGNLLSSVCFTDTLKGYAVGQCGETCWGERGAGKDVYKTITK
jgi:hypothetical protein